jgi:hypothetical protein
MQQMPEHFLEIENNQKSREIKNIWDFADKISYELSKNT